MKIVKGIKVRIYPTSKQKALIIKNIGCSRKVYNATLAYRKESYAQGIKLKKSDINRFLTGMKNNKEYSYLNEVDSTCLQQAQIDLDSAYKKFFTKQNKFPKFHSKHNSHQSYRSESNGHNIYVRENNFIQIPKLGLVKYRGIINDYIYKINNATVSMNKTGKFYVSLCCEVEYSPIKNEGCLIGIDVGLREFYTDSNGNVVHNPKFLEKAEKKLKRLQRQFSKKQKGSNNKEKARIKLAKQYEKVSNQKIDFLQKLTTALIKENQLICVENLNIEGMLKNHKLAKHIQSASWSMFFRLLEYKCERNGNDLVKIDTFYPSSQICSNCGEQNPEVKDLREEWVCPKCGTKHNRDYNAAKNILEQGKQIFYSKT